MGAGVPQTGVLTDVACRDDGTRLTESPLGLVSATVCKNAPTENHPMMGTPAPTPCWPRSTKTMGTKTLASAAVAANIGVGVRETGGVMKIRALNPRKLTSGLFFGWAWVVPWLLVMSSGVVGVKGVPIPDCTYPAYNTPPGDCVPPSCWNVRTCGIRQAVDTYTTQATIDKYGPIEDWDTSLVTDMSHVFDSKGSFNVNISKWITGAVTSMAYSKCAPSPSLCPHLPLLYF